MPKASKLPEIKESSTGRKYFLLKNKRVWLPKDATRSDVKKAVKKILAKSKKKKTKKAKTKRASTAKTKRASTAKKKVPISGIAEPLVPGTSRSYEGGAGMAAALAMQAAAMAARAAGDKDKGNDKDKSKPVTDNQLALLPAARVAGPEEDMYSQREVLMMGRTQQLMTHAEKKLMAETLAARHSQREKEITDSELRISELKREKDKYKSEFSTDKVEKKMQDMAKENGYGRAHAQYLKAMATKYGIPTTSDKFLDKVTKAMIQDPGVEGLDNLKEADRKIDEIEASIKQEKANLRALQQSRRKIEVDIEQVEDIIAAAESSPPPRTQSALQLEAIEEEKEREEKYPSPDERALAFENKLNDIQKRRALRKLDEASINPVVRKIFSDDLQKMESFGSAQRSMRADDDFQFFTEMQRREQIPPEWWENTWEIFSNEQKQRYKDKQRTKWEREDEEARIKAEYEADNIVFNNELHQRGEIVQSLWYIGPMDQVNAFKAAIRAKWQREDEAAAARQQAWAEPAPSPTEQLSESFQHLHLESPQPSPNPEQQGEGSSRDNRDPGLSTEQIDEIMAPYSEYLGCIASDQIGYLWPKPQSRGGFVMNLDPISKPGSHWVAVFFDARPNGSLSIEYYDPLADLPTEGFIDDISAFADQLGVEGYLKFKTNKVADQSSDTSNCGWFATKFLIDRFRGKSFAEASGYADRYPVGERNIERFKSYYNIQPFSYLPFSQEGDGLKDIVKKGVKFAKSVGQRVKDVFRGLRNEAPPAMRRWVAKYGDVQIVEMKVCRKPIFSIIEKLANLISGGKWTENKEKLSYDKMMHLFMLVKLANGMVVMLEKNHVAQIVNAKWNTDSKTETVPVNVDSNFTMSYLLEKGEKQAGSPDKFWIYDARSQNCQYFLKWIISGCGKLTSELEKFIMQDAGKVLEGLGYLGKAAKAITDVAGIGDVIMNGRGSVRRGYGGRR